MLKSPAFFVRSVVLHKHLLDDGMTVEIVLGLRRRQAAMWVLVVDYDVVNGVRHSLQAEELYKKR